MWFRDVGVLAARVSLVLALAGSATSATDLPADTAVFGERPDTFRDDVTPFPPAGSTWQFRVDGNDPITRLKFFEVPGLKNGLRRFTARITSLGKYVVLGNVETDKAGGNSTDLRVGIFNSETKEYCDLIIKSDLGSKVAQLVTANPGARQSRIVIAPGTRRELGGDAAFGYIEADLDMPDPCSWPVVLVSSAELNAGLAFNDMICPDNTCAFDTLVLLGHENDPGDPFGRDYVAVGEYYSGRNAVIRIDASGIAVADTYNIPIFDPPYAGGGCWAAGAARPGSSDFRQPDARPPNDWRFYFSHDSLSPKPVYPTNSPPQCGTPYPWCPLDESGDPEVLGVPCSSSSCDQGYCSRPIDNRVNFQDCTTTSDCDAAALYLGKTTLGVCQKTCLPKNPFFRCRTAAGGGSLRQCLTDKHCDSDSDESCSPGNVPDKVFPAQEYRFDKTMNKITPMSGMFFSAGTALGPKPALPTSFTYASDGSVWVFNNDNVGFYRRHDGTDDCVVNGQVVPAPDGERCYHNPTNPTTATIVPPDEVLEFERAPVIPYQAQTLEIAGKMYFADNSSLQYAQAYSDSWTTIDDTIYKAAFAYASPHIPATDPSVQYALPAEPHQCSTNGLGCYSSADCPIGQTCDALEEADVTVENEYLTLLKFLELGGSPKSLWVTSGYGHKPPVPQTDVYLERIPVAIDLPDNHSAVRAAIAWGNDRLWLVGQQDGALKYRIRDDGIWSDWFPLTPHNITPVGGAAVIAGATTPTRIYVRDGAGKVHQKILTSSTTCVPGTCTWSSWTALPATLSTNDDIAAAYAGTVPFVAVRALNDGLYVTGQTSGWSAWFRVGALMATNAAPSLTYHAPDGRLWIAARHKGSGALMSARINPSTFAWDPWAGLPTAPVATWGYAPAIVSDGTKVRMFGIDGAYPQFAWQIINDGTGWSGWRKPLGFAWGTRQPAAANIHGEIDLLTDWYVAGMHETLLP